jgi:hypothetical protein
VYSSVQGILRTLVQRGIFEETGLPVDTGGLRKISQNQTGEMAAYRIPTYHPFCAARVTLRTLYILLCMTSTSANIANIVLHCVERLLQGKQEVAGHRYLTYTSKRSSWHPGRTPPYPGAKALANHHRAW